MELSPWRRMTRADLPAVVRLGDAVHLAHPEDARVFAERLSLYPAGCFVLPGATAQADIRGYAITHPWRRRAPPALNATLGSIDVPTTYYIHDLTLAPEARGAGATAPIIAAIATHAAAHGFLTLSLVAIPGLATYWARWGFATVDTLDIAAKLAAYGPGARYMERAA